MTLAADFFAAFRGAFDQSCRFKGTLKETWEAKKGWTEFMLKEPDGVLFAAAEEWAQRVGFESHSIHREWRKFDVMVVAPKWGQGAQWWQSVPVLTIEHENDNQIHDEIWNLACWRSRLKVLVTYHDNSGQHAEKLMLAARILWDHYESDGAEYLVLSAPRTVEPNWEWRADEWAGKTGWEKLEV